MSLFPHRLPHHSCYLSRVEPRVRFLLGLFTIIVLLVVSSWSSLLFLFFLIVTLTYSVRPLRNWFWYRMSLALFTLMPFLIVMPFISQAGEPDWSYRYLEFRWGGVYSAAALAIRSLSIVCVILTLLTAGPINEYLNAAQRLGFPNLIVNLMGMTYRYVFLLVEELGRLRISLRVRGFRNRMSKHAYRTVSQAAGTLLVRSVQRAESVGHAMQARGFSGVFPIGPSPPWHRIDTIILGGGIIFLTQLLAWDLWLRFN